jgi:anionic cell wall polymer biosynthesis LytR-Cps2A-Psr (LCP) family protein
MASKYIRPLIRLSCSLFVLLTVQAPALPAVYAGAHAPAAQAAPTPTSAVPATGFDPSLVITMVTTVISNGVSIAVETPLNLGVVPPPVDPIRLPAGTINIALLGTDTRPQQGGLNTDVIMIASLHPDQPVVTLFSIPRDVLVYIPGRHMHKVNTAYNKGADMFRKTILHNFGIRIDYYALVDFSGVVKTVDALGGIEVVATCPLYHVFPKDPYYFADETSPMTVTAPYTDSFTGEPWVVGERVPTQTIEIPRPGVYELNGMETLAFARARYGVPGGDIDRGRRAQRVVRALLNEIRHDASLATIPTLYEQYSRSVYTDMGLTDIVRLASQSNRLDALAIRNRFFDGVGLTAVTLPRVGAVLIPDRAAVTQYVQRALTVNANVRANDGIPVELWNATYYDDYTAAATDRLRELGFIVVESKRVKVEPKSSIIDFSTSAKGGALPLLLRSFGMQQSVVLAEPQEMANGARYRIIAGADFNTCYQRGYEYPIHAVASPPGTQPLATPAATVAVSTTVTAAVEIPAAAPTATVVIPVETATATPLPLPATPAPPDSTPEG